MTPSEFRSLDERDQAEMIAYIETKRKMEAYEAQTRNKEMEAQQRNAKR